MGGQEELILLQGYVSGGSEWIMDSGCTNHMTGDKELFAEDKLTESSQKYITFGDDNKGKVLVWVRFLYQRTNTLIRLCLSNLLDTISCQYQSYVIWVCLCCFLLRIVLCFHRRTTRLSSRVFEREISTLLISLRDLLYPPA